MTSNYPPGVTPGNFDRLCWGPPGTCERCGGEAEYGYALCEDCETEQELEKQEEENADI